MTIVVVPRTAAAEALSPLLYIQLRPSHIRTVGSNSARQVEKLSCVGWTSLRPAKGDPSNPEDPNNKAQWAPTAPMGA